MNIKITQLLPYIFLILLFASCKKELENGLNAITLESNYEGIRGEIIDIEAIVVSEDGIKSVTANPSNGDPFIFNVPPNSNSLDLELSFPIPADAILNTSYMINLVLEDLDGDIKEENFTITVAPVLSSSPSVYNFIRNNESSVSYSGQNERLDQVEAIKNYLKEGDAGNQLSAATLYAAYSNEGGNGNGFFEFSSTKQLRDKTFLPDLDDRFMETLFEDLEVASNSGATASNGVAGLIVRENSGNTILVNASGREYTQLIEKGLMGTVMYNQIYNTYFSDVRIGNDVENTELVEGKNYTSMEHHWDEAFGYWNPPLDFSSNWPSDRESEDRFWSHYSNTVDPFIGTNDQLMQAFLDGRTAIVNNDLDEKNVQRDILFEKLELVSAAVTIHYINDALEALNENKIGEAFHVMSEAWAFVNALKYSPNRKISVEEIIKIQETDLGSDGNFWNVNAAGLNTAKSTLVSIYPELASVQDQL
jgi:hypothetical protein